jgi:hypothetical protein
MTEPDVPGPDIGSHEVIHLGGQAAAVVPVADFLRLRALEQAASPGSSRTPRIPRRCWRGRPATPRSRQRMSRQLRGGAAWAYSSEPAGRLRRARDQPGGRVPRRPARHPRGPGRHRPAGRRSPPCRVVPVRLPRPATGCGSAGTGSCTRSPPTQSRSGTSPTASRADWRQIVVLSDLWKSGVPSDETPIGYQSSFMPM